MTMYPSRNYSEAMFLALLFKIKLLGSRIHMGRKSFVSYCTKRLGIQYLYHMTPSLYVLVGRCLKLWEVGRIHTMIAFSSLWPCHAILVVANWVIGVRQWDWLDRGGGPCGYGWQAGVATECECECATNGHEIWF